MTAPPDAGAPAERFLSGRVIARQPARGYRASVDSVLLGCAIMLAPGARALELGCGAGAALLIAAWRNPGGRFVGVECEAEAAALAEANVLANDLADRVAITRGDALAPGPERREAFDHVFANPPYLDDPAAMRPPRDPARRRAFVTGPGGLEAWVTAALAATPSRGRITVIHRADRLDDLLTALRGRVGEVRVRPVQPRAEAPAKRVLVTARKGVRGPMALLAPLVLHGADGTLTAAAAASVERGEELSLRA
ncbi:MAG: methyltransferase [Caulobacterales bacterium]|nr:methyltransferase [Caulobacterales bacterium]